MRKMGVTGETIEGLNKNMDTTLEGLAEQAYAKVSAATPPKSEGSNIKIEITKRAVQIAADVAAGTRLSISIENDQAVAAIAEKTGLIEADVRRAIEEPKAREQKLEAALALVGGEVKALPKE